MKVLACIFVGLIASAAAQSTATAPTTAFAPTSEMTTASAPNPSAAPRLRSGQYAADSLATTPTSLNQIQTVGTFSSAHTAPPAAIQNYLGTPAAQAAIPASAFVPQSTQYTQLQLYNQLENLGIRQYHFPIYYDPAGNNYTANAGLKIANQSANVSAQDPKWGYPGWKVMNEPNFDWNSSCTTLSTCLQVMKNWLLTTPNTNPITIYLEPTTYVYTSNNATFAAALAASNQTGAPNTLATPLNIETFEPLFQPWRDLENELISVFDKNAYFTILTPENVMGDDDNLVSAVMQDGYTLYPALKDLQNRLIFVLTGNYTNNYLQYYPDLINATMFIAEPYNDAGNYTNSTLFVDVVGPLAGTNATNFTASSVSSALSTQTAAITKTVKAGYMVRASADWNTVEPRYNYTTRFSQVLAAGAHYVQTAFPSTPTLFPSTYTAALPIRANSQQSVRCNPVTSGGTISTALYSSGCPAPTGSPSQAPSASSSS